MKNNNIPIAIIAAIFLAYLIGFIGWTQPKAEIVPLGGYTVEDWEAGDDLIAGDDLTVADDGTIGDDLAVTGQLTADSLLWTGGTTTLSFATTTVDITLTAAQCCDYSIISGIYRGAATTTFPGTSTLYADCLQTEGAQKSFLLINDGNTASSTTITAGSGGTVLYATSTDTTIYGSSTAEILLQRVGVNSYYIVVTPLGQ